MATTPDATAPPTTAIAPDDAPLHGRDWVEIALPGLIWGSSFFLIAEGLEAFDPFLVTWLRLLFGLAVIVATPAARVRVESRHWPRLVLLGVVWMAVPLSLFPFAEERVSSSVTGMLNGATPVFTAIVAGVVVRRPPPARQLLGLVVGIVGIALIASPSWSEGSSSAVGVVLILVALACYGVALNVAGPLQRTLGGMPVIVRTLAVATVLLAPFGVAGIGDSGFAWRSALAVAALGAFGTGVAYVLMAANAGRYGSTRAASATYLIPGVSLALGVVFRGEDVHAIAIVGSAIALAGAYLVNTAVRAAAVRATPAGGR
jgi:drug/metabolite transporter (DMT)-like permease